MNHLRKGLLTLALIFVTAITFAQVSITVNVPTAGGFSAALTAAGGDANTVTNLTVTGNINATDIAFMKAMPVLAVLDLENAQVTSNYFPDNAFSNNTHITSIKLPNTITTIGRFSFSYCTGLTGSLIIPSNVTTIYFCAFEKCSKLTGNLVFPNTVTSIGIYAFDGCKGFTGSLIIPNSVTNIGSNAFSGCSGFTGDLTIPDKINIIEISTFENCTGLNGSLTIPSSVTTIKERAFYNCSKLTGNLFFPNSVTTIGKNAFNNCTGFKGILTLPNSISSIGEAAFMYCSGLTGSLNFPNTITSIGDWAFQDCSSLNGTLTLPNSITYIGIYAFDNCSGLIGTLILPSSLTTINSGVFYNCSNLTGTLIIPNSIKTIGSSAFAYCKNLTGKLTIPSSVNSIGSGAFSDCTGFTGNLTIPPTVTSLASGVFNGCTGFSGNLTIPNSISTLGFTIFQNCSNLTGNLIIPNSITQIESYAFYNCQKLTGNLTIPNSVTSISGSAFEQCTNLTGTITIPSSVSYIGDKAFFDCSKINKITTARTVPLSIGSSTFFGINKTTCQLIVPYGTTAVYKAANYWKDFLNITELIYVSFNSQGGTPIADLNPSYNSTIAAPTDPTRTGYTFGGWYKEAACTNAWNFSSDVITTNITLYAKWTINVYTVNFDSQGGPTVASVNTNYNTTITAPTAPTQTGYTFGGWYKEVACTNAWNFTTDVVTSNTTLYAKWAINVYTVTFNSQGGSAVASINANHNTTITSPTAPTRTGYTFGGWYKDAACTNAWDFDTDLVTANTTLYAKWTINVYTVTFNSQGGSSVASVNANYNTTITVPTAPIRTGYTFGGWFKEAACTNTWNFTTNMVTANTTLYAKWTINVYTVTFNSQGGSAVASVNTNYNTTITAPTAPTRTGYTFGGWYREAACTNAWNFTTDVVTANTTLYVKWTINVYTVTFNAQGGTVVANVNTNYNTTITEPTAPTRTGYTFGGWYKEAACLSSWSFATDVVTTNTVLYAKWIINQYIVYFDPNGGGPATTFYINYNNTVSTPTSPTRSGYTFGGWYKEVECTNAWNFSTNVITANTTIYAKWTFNVYTVLFDSQGGSAVASVNANYNSTIATPSTPTRTGYTFGGWYKEAACNNAWNFTTNVITTNTTLYAKWTINVYAVTFNSQGGSAVASINANYNTIITTPTAPTLTGYTFGGWYKEAACTNAWIFASDVVTANTTLYAKWTINLYAVTFDSQGGPAVASVNANYNTTITAPTAPTRTGYTFGGWYKEAACTNTWAFATDLVTANTTLYAKWTINTYTVTFDSQGGPAVASVNANYNTTITAPTAPTRTGYTFGGWYKEAACTIVWSFATDVVTANTTLYAKWTINTYTVTFNSQGGSAVGSVVTNYNTTIAAPSIPAKTGYTFGGWYKEAACTIVWSFATDVVTANTTLYAKWTINTYTVTFNSQGGSIVAIVNANYNTNINAPTTPTLTGYTFGGWYKEATCTNAWTFASDVVIANTTLYAKWTINVYTVTFNAQGGSAVTSVITNYNTTISTPTAPTRTGYTFGGWYKEAACTNTWAFGADMVVGNITLYAKWTINTYTVTFNSNGGTSVASVTADYNTKIIEPIPPTKTGYTFIGWYINLSDDFSFNFNLYMITSNLTLQAKWIPNTYYVSFYSQGIVVDSRGVEYNTTVAQPEDPIRTGYVFNGWFKEPTFTTSWNFSTDRVTSNTSLYAKWTAITYTVTFDSQGGAPVASIVVNHGAKVAEPTPPLRNGYTLRGWYDQPTDGFLWFFDYSTVTQDITLYAHWNINSYTITFDSKGGSAVASKTVEYNSTITEPSSPTRTGYTFVGWYKDETLTSIWNFNSDAVTANATLYAKWSVNSYIVSFDSQGGSNVSYIQVNYNSTFTRPADPTRTGYTFAGWFKDQALTNEWNFSTDVVTNHMYLYAKWAINTYTVSFNTQGGSAISNVTANYNSTVTALSAPTRTGYTFNGWYKEAGCINPWAFASDVVTTDITLYAKWTINTYTVTFNTQGGSAISSVSVNFNTTITTPSAPTRTGYTFDGWYNEAGCINPWTFATDVVTSDITLYAKWNLSNDIETNSGNRFKLYPNPAVSSLTIEGENIEDITVYSSNGAKALQPIINPKESKYTFSIEGLKSGFYFVRVKTSGNKIATVKFIKQ